MMREETMSISQTSNKSHQEPCIYDNKDSKYTFRVLVVDDDIVTRELIKKYLCAEGYELEFAEDGVDAHGKIIQKKFDLILLDVLMHNLGGFQLIELLREESEDTPVIFVTAKTSTEDEIKGLRLGAVDFIRKPIHKEILHLRVRNILQKQKELLNLKVRKVM
jgi:DNA-binding response OmpR family regulator